MAFPLTRAPRTIAVVYLVAGGLWIAVSEMLLGAVVGLSPGRTPLAIVSGWLFVTITAGLLCRLLRRYAAAETAAAMERFFEAAVQAIAVSQRDGRIEQVNRSAEALFGHRRDELIGQPIELLLPADDAPGGVGVYLPASPPGEARVRRLGRRKDGTRFPIELSKSTVRIGETDRVVSFITDIRGRGRPADCGSRRPDVPRSPRAVAPGVRAGVPHRPPAAPRRERLPGREDGRPRPEDAARAPGQVRYQGLISQETRASPARGRRRIGGGLEQDAWPGR